MCEHERNVADNLAQLDAIKALITPIKLSIHSKMSAVSVQDSIAYSDINCVAELIGDNLVCSLVKLYYLRNFWLYLFIIGLIWLWLFLKPE